MMKLFLLQQHRITRLYQKQTADYTEIIFNTTKY